MATDITGKTLSYNTNKIARRENATNEIPIDAEVYSPRVTANRHGRAVRVVARTRR